MWVIWDAVVSSGSLAADLRTTETAVAHRIADILDGPDGRGDVGYIDVSNDAVDRIISRRVEV